MAYSKAQRYPLSQRGKKGFVAQNWWVMAFIALCAFVYFHSVSKKKEVIGTLDKHLAALNREKTSLLSEKEDLLLQIGSQSDPAWIRLTLMKGLGLVPEGQIKVYFYKDDR